jgi:6-phosphofructokinase 1
MLATRFGSFAVELLLRGEFGVMTALQSPDIVAVPIERIVGRTRNVPVAGDVVRTARNVGICFGET